MCIPDNLEAHAWNFRAWHLGTQSQHLISTATHGIPSTFFRGCGGSTTKHMLLDSSMIFLTFAALPYFFALRLTICSCYHTSRILYIFHWHSSYRLEICKRTSYVCLRTMASDICRNWHRCGNPMASRVENHLPMASCSTYFCMFTRRRYVSYRLGTTLNPSLVITTINPSYHSYNMS